MITYTSKGLAKPGDGDFQDVSVLDGNADRLDTYGMGPVVCTSTTRPTGSNRWDGMLAYETDTDTVVKYSAANDRWKALSQAFEACAWKLDANVALTLGVFTKITWGTAIETDLDAGITHAAGNVTVSETGIYEVTASLVFDDPAGTGTQKRLSQIVTVNAPAIDGSGNVTGGYVWVADTQVVAGIASITGVNNNVKTRRKKLTAGDYISTFAFTDVGGVQLSTHANNNYAGVSTISVERFS